MKHFLCLALLGCSSPTTTPVDASTVDASTTDAVVDVVNDTDAGAAKLSVVANFNAQAFELPEGLAFHKGAAYVGFAPLGKIQKVDSNGTVTPYGSVPPGYNAGYTLGLAFDAQDNLYVLETKNDPDAGSQNPGIYKIPAGGGNVTTPFASDPQMIFPNGIDFDAQGNLMVADSATGIIFKVTPAGQVSKWLQDPELSGSPACPAPLPFPIGANGIVVTPSDVFVSNTAKGSIVRIAVNNGAAGPVSTIVKDCQWVGFDGIARDKDGTLLAVQNGVGGKLVRITTSGNVSVLAQNDPLDGPGSVAFADGWNGSRVALVTNTAFFSVGVEGGSPKPGLLVYGPLQ
jgi:sugar lactone lactonase YvrE